MVAKKGRNESAGLSGEANTPPFLGGVSEVDRQGQRSGLNGVTASAIGMGLVLQGQPMEARASTGGDGVPDDAGDAERREVPPDVVESDPYEQKAPQDALADEMSGGDADDPVGDAELAASGPVVAAGRTSGIDDAGAAASATAAMLSDNKADEVVLSREGEAGQPAVELDFDSDEDEGLPGSVFEPVLGDDGIVDNLLDVLVGEGGVLDGLLGEDGLLDDVLDTLVGEDGILDLSVLEGLLGEDGYLGGAINVILGDEGLVADIVGEDGVVGDLLEALVEDDGVLDSLLSPVLGGGVVDDLLGEDGIVPGLIGDLFGGDGLVDEVVGNIPVVGDLLGSGGLLGVVFGENGALGGVLGFGGDDEDSAASDEAVEPSEDDGFLDDLLGLGETAEGAADEAAGIVTDLFEGLSLDGVGDVMTDLLGDEDIFGVDVPETATDGFDDLYAGLVGETSLVGTLAGEGLIGETADLLADGEVDALLNEILGPSSSDVTGGEGVFDALFGEADESGETQVGGLLAETGGLVDGIVNALDSDASLLDGLLSTQDDSV